MKKLALIFSLLLAVQFNISAKNFDEIFKKFKSVENAEYVKIPGFLMKLIGGNDLKINGKVDDLPLNMEFNGVKVLELESCSEKAKKQFTNAVTDAGKKCELMLETSGDGDDVSIWLEPKNAKKFNKMVIFAKSDYALIEISGKFTFEE